MASFFSKSCTSTAKLVGKTAVVTGCNTGIGKETVMDFYKRGARVIMACRNVEKAEEAKNSIEEECKNLPGTGTLVVIQCDLTSLRSVRECAQKILDTEPQVNILVNNAGIMMCPKGETEEGFETHFGTNHLAHFLLTLLLLPRMRNSTPARIVTVSSVVHMISGDFKDIHFKHRSYNAREAYCQSKLANVLFSKELSNKLKEYNIEGINTYSLHPGVIRTEIFRHVTKKILVFSGARAIYDFISYPFMKSPLQGAQTNIYCSVDEKCANETGLYYSECSVTTPSKKARDDTLSKMLWDYSIEAVNLGDFNPFTAVDCGVKNNDCSVTTPSEDARDDIAKKLWDYSVEAVKLGVDSGVKTP